MKKTLLTVESYARLPALGNDRRGRHARARLAKEQRVSAKYSCLAESDWEKTRAMRERLKAPDGALRVVLERWLHGKDQRQDDDGLRASFKHIRDGVADFLEQDDSEWSGIDWVYRQERACYCGAPDRHFHVDQCNDYAATVPPSKRVKWRILIETAVCVCGAEQRWSRELGIYCTGGLQCSLRRLQAAVGSRGSEVDPELKSVRAVPMDRAQEAIRQAWRLGFIEGGGAFSVNETREAARKSKVLRKLLKEIES